MAIETVQPTDAGSATAQNGLDPSAADVQATGLDSSVSGEKLTDADRAKRWQSTATKAQQELKALKDRLGDDLVGNPQINGDLVRAVFREYQTLANDPTVGQALRTYRDTGKFVLSAQNGETAEEYLTDTEKRQQQEIGELRQQLNVQTQNLGMSSFASHVERVFTDLELTGEQAEKVKTQIANQIGQWDTQGPAGKQAMLDLQHPTKGRETVDLLVSKALGAKGMLELAEQRLQKRNRTRSGMATDSPSQYGTTGDEPPPRYTGKTALLDALRDARARPELLGKYGGG